MLEPSSTMDESGRIAKSMRQSSDGSRWVPAVASGALQRQRFGDMPVAHFLRAIVDPGLARASRPRAEESGRRHVGSHDKAPAPR